MKIRSGEQRFYEKWISFRFPMLFSGIAEVEEWFDDKTNHFHIRVQVVNDRFGPLFGYHGKFLSEYLDISKAKIPEHVKPVREESRE